MPTLREFLERGLWPIDIAEPQEVLPYNHPRYMPEPPNIARVASPQSIKVLEATPQRRIVVRYNPSLLQRISEQLETHLRLDAPVPSEIVAAHTAAEASSTTLAPLHQLNCHAAISHVYGVVNSIIVDGSLRRGDDPHLWTMWNMEKDSTYLARGLEGNTTSRTAIADAVCVTNRGSTYGARGLVVCKLASQLTPEERASRMQGFARMVTSPDGLQVYLSSATKQVRLWNSPLPNRQAKFWANLMTEIWEMMHSYRCQTILFTSWNRAGFLVRTGVQNISFSPVTGAGCPDTPVELNMLQALLGLALCRLHDPVDNWTEFPGEPSKIPRPPKPPVQEDLPATLPVNIYGLERAPCVTAHMFQTHPDDDDALLSFLSGPESGHSLELGSLYGTDGPYAIYTVEQTTLAPKGVRVVAKVAKLGTIPVHDSKSMLSRSGVRDTVINEATLYCGALARLQGTVVPHFYGLLEGYLGADRAPIMIMLLEDVGTPISHSAVDRSAVIPLYEALFDANVVHGDIGVHHTMMRDGELRLVSFFDSWTVDPTKPREMADLLDVMRSVYREWDLEIPVHLRNIRPPWEMDESGVPLEDAAVPEASIASKSPHLDGPPLYTAVLPSPLLGGSPLLPEVN